MDKCGASRSAGESSVMRSENGSGKRCLRASVCGAREPGWCVVHLPHRLLVSPQSTAIGLGRIYCWIADPWKKFDKADVDVAGSYYRIIVFLVGIHRPPQGSESFRVKNQHSLHHATLDLMRNDDITRNFFTRRILLWARAVYEERTSFGYGWLQKESDALANNILTPLFDSGLRRCLREL